MIRVLPYLLYLWLIAFHHVILKDLVSIYDVSINLTILIVLLVSFYKNELTIIWFSFFLGLVSYIDSGAMLGGHIIILCLIGVTAYQLKEKLNLESLMARMLVVSGGCLVHGLILLITSGMDNWLELIFLNVIPGVIYTSLIGWLFFLIKDGKITFKKIRSIF